MILRACGNAALEGIGDILFSGCGHRKKARRVGEGKDSYGVVSLGSKFSRGRYHVLSNLLEQDDLTTGALG